MRFALFFPVFFEIGGRSQATLSVLPFASIIRNSTPSRTSILPLPRVTSTADKGRRILGDSPPLSRSVAMSLPKIREQPLGREPERFQRRTFRAFRPSNELTDLLRDGRVVADGDRGSGYRGEVSRPARRRQPTQEGY